MTTVRLKKLDNAGTDRVKFAERAVQLLEVIVNNKQFQERVATGNYTGRRFRQDNTLPIRADNNLILEQILSGKEYKTPPDGEISIQASLKELGRSEVGHVYPPNPLITTNTLFFNKWFGENDTLSLAAHWMHEWLHVSGFSHATKNPDLNDVNYLTGTFVIETGKEMALLFSESLAQVQGEGYLTAYCATHGRLNVLDV